MTSKGPPKPHQSRPLSSGERALWQAYTRGMRRLDPEEAEAEPTETAQAETPDSPSRLPIPVAQPASGRPNASPSATPTSHLSPVLHHGQRTDLDRATAKKFFSGRMGVQARLDLHGMNRQRAHTALTGFILNAHQSRFRAVLVITGKGSRSGGDGILRRDVPMWLNDPPLRGCILAFGHARPGDGGEGALYVLIRRKRR